MTFEKIPLRMLKLGVDRAWLALQCDYSASHIAKILAPNGDIKAKTDKALRRIWESLDREEVRQKAAEPKPILESHSDLPLGHYAIRLSGEELIDAERAARIVNATLSEFCRDTIKSHAKKLIEEQRKKMAPKGDWVGNICYFEFIKP